MRKYITKSRAGHYTATVKDGGRTLFKKTLLASLREATYMANEFIASATCAVCGNTTDVCVHCHFCDDCGCHPACIAPVEAHN